MKLLFFAYTQYHILNVLNIKLNIYPNDDADVIFINPKQAQTEKIIRNLKFENIFDRILILENERKAKKKVGRYIEHIKSIIHMQINTKIINTFIANEVYDIYFTYGSSLESYYIYDRICSSIIPKYINYEEGLGTYYLPIENALNRIYTLYLKKVLKVKIPVYPDELWIYLPSCYKDSDSLGDYIVKSLPHLDTNQNTIQKINKVFGYNGQRPKKKILIFEQVIPGYEENQVDINHLFNLSLTEIKMHPRSKAKESYRDMDIFDSEGIPWELVCINSDFSDRVLVSFFSTTCCSPKSVMNQEPYVILLYKIKELSGVMEVDSRKEDFIKKFEKTYENINRVFCPTCLAELDEILRFLEIQ